MHHCALFSSVFFFSFSFGLGFCAQFFVEMKVIVRRAGRSRRIYFEQTHTQRTASFMSFSLSPPASVVLSSAPPATIYCTTCRNCPRVAYKQFLLTSVYFFFFFFGPWLLLLSQGAPCTAHCPPSTDHRPLASKHQRKKRK